MRRSRRIVEYGSFSGILIWTVLSKSHALLNQSTSVMAQEAAKNPAADLAACKRILRI